MKDEVSEMGGEREKNRQRKILHLPTTPTGVQLLNVRRAVTSESTYQVPQPAPITTPELASDEEMEEPSSGVTLGKRAESVESLLSLSDVEVGMEEHAGVLEEVDHPRRKIRRRVRKRYMSQTMQCRG